MLRVALLVLVALASVGAALWAVQSPNDIRFQGPGFEGETSRAAIVLGLLLVGAVIAIAWGVLAWTVGLPGRITRGSRTARMTKARTALADGLIAAEGGDAIAAAKHAKRAAVLSEGDAGGRKLSLLLAARAAEANGDWTSAERAYAQLSREKGAELAGYRGLAAAAVKRGDRTGALAHAKAALDLKGKADWPFGSLFELQTAAADWDGAIETLAEGEKRGRIAVDAARRRRAVLLTAEATRLRRNDPESASEHANRAAKLAPGLPAASALSARIHLAAGRTGKAGGAIEAAWRARPHPALSLIWSDLKPSESANAHADRIRHLASLNPPHRESRILIGEAAIAAGDWREAAEALKPIVEDGATSRLCTLMEAIARGRGSTEDANRWARLAVSAPREPDWSDIDPDGRAFDYSDADWARLVYAYGDGAQLIHPRYESYGRELAATTRIALPAPGAAPPDTPSAPVADYVAKD